MMGVFAEFERVMKLTPNVELRSLCQPCWLAYFLIVLCHDFNHRKLIFKR